MICAVYGRQFVWMVLCARLAAEIGGVVENSCVETWKSCGKDDDSPMIRHIGRMYWSLAHTVERTMVLRFIRR